MSLAVWVVVGVIIVGAIIGAVFLIAVATGGLGLPWRPGYYDFTPRLGTPMETYDVRTPAGPAVVTRVWTDTQGEGFLVQPKFGDHDDFITTRSTAIARARLRELAEAHKRRGTARSR